ncbi:hypothetical protein BD289DRAFT_283389 [Coniella lustricola]|uniref:Uncharacterized protein n=1 Tax=Coniella lustricola TaxID=2025994 RepID=A0A2T3AK16_9PEZI|nr:hypothetical protein BD289DRAFT_283389 [Coniella lustricola]
MCVVDAQLPSGAALELRDHVSQRVQEPILQVIETPASVCWAHRVRKSRFWIAVSTHRLKLRIYQDGLTIDHCSVLLSSHGHGSPCGLSYGTTMSESPAVARLFLECRSLLRRGYPRFLVRSLARTSSNNSIAAQRPIQSGSKYVSCSLASVSVRTQN